MDAPVSPVAVTRPPRREWGRAGWALVLGAFAVGFAQGPMAAVGWGFTHLPGDRIDGVFNRYVLEHGHRWVRGEVEGFWDLPVYHPAPRVTAYSDAHLGSLPLFAGLRAAGLSPEAAYQVWFLLPFALNYAAAAWAARRVGGGPVAAATSGFVFAFAVTALQHTVGHSQLGPRFLVPPAVLLAHSWLKAPTVRRLALLAACLVGQAYLTLYIAYYLGLLVLATWLATALLNQREVGWPAVGRGWWKWLLVGAVAVAALVPLVRPYLRAAGDHMTTDPRWLELYTPTAWAWLLAPDLGWHAAWMHGPFPPPADHPGLPELHLFPGWLPLVGLLAAAALTVRRPDPPAVFAVAALVVVACTTRVGGVCLYDPVFQLPGGGSIRVVARVVLVLLFPAGLGLGFLMEEVSRGRWTLGAALVALVAVDQAVILPGGPRGEVWATHRIRADEGKDYIDRLVALVRRERPDAKVLYVFPKPTESDALPAAGVRQMDVVWAARELGVPTVNGYSGYWPNHWTLARDYDALFRWLPPERRAGLVVVGEPSGPGADTPSGRAARAAHPPLPWPDD